MQEDEVTLVAPDDPLHNFLTEAVLRDELGVEVQNPVWTTEPLGDREAVYLYKEEASGKAVVGKFYGQKRRSSGTPVPEEASVRWLRQEFEHLQQVRDLGFDRSPHRVVRPLAMNASLDAMLVESYVTGDSLDVTLDEAHRAGDERALRERLHEVARFFATLHDRSQRVTPTHGQELLAYLTKVIGQLVEKEVIDEARRADLCALRDQWEASGLLHSPTQVLVHGDATPANFFFTDSGDLVAIDLERMHLADQALDLGCMVAELQHWFLRRLGTPWPGEWAAQTFCRAYQDTLNLSATRRDRLMTRVRFCRGAYLLRIARNEWLDMPYRRRLVQEGEKCLRR